MTKDQLEALFERVRALPPEKLDQFGEYLDWLEGQHGAIYVLSPEERADLEVALAEMDQGDVATDEEVKAVFGHHV